MLAAMLLASPVAAQQAPPVRPLGPVTKVSAAGLLGAVSVVRPLPDGGVLVNDITRRQLVLFDGELRKVKTVIDGSDLPGGPLSGPLGGLLAFKGDSSLFIDPRALTVLVLDAQGVESRVMAVPSVRDAALMIGGPFGMPGYDPRGRIVFRGVARNAALARDVPRTGTSPLRSMYADSAPVYSVDLASRKREILAQVRIQRTLASSTWDNRDVLVGNTMVVDPMPIVDDWTLLPDGRLVVVRGGDYHLDWLGLDGRWTSTAKIPYHWERLDDDAKQRLVDSVTAQREREREAAKLLAESKNLPGAANIGSSSARNLTSNAGGKNPDVSAVRPSFEMLRMTMLTLPAKDLPDYRPAFRQGAVRADVQGNVWVRTTAPSDAGAIYDVINGKGELIDRVKVPFGRVIAGFGPGVVYMGVLDEAGARLEVARIR